jgi:hypothetical protein
MRVVSWYKSWFSTRGTLDVEGYVKHIVAALAFFFGFFILGASLFFILLQVLIAAPAPVGAAAWLPVLIWLPIGLLAVGSFIGILVTSSVRFVRHMMQH